MLNKRAILILFLLIIGILTISSVSANDSASDILNNASVDEIGINDENIDDLSEGDVEITGLESDDDLESADSGTFSALQKKIDNAKEGSTITLENDYYYTQDTDGDIVPTITKSLTINGNGHVINGTTQSGLLRILGHKNIVLDNIIFQSGYASEVIYANNLNDLRIYNCNFVENIGYYGGALFIDNTDYVEINRTNFVENTGFLGGASFINNTEKIFFINCEFNDNYAKYGGACCLINYDQAYSGNCNFTNNYGNQTGGAIYLTGNQARVEACEFSKNVATYGGAITSISSSKTEIIYCRFTNNKAQNGGAINFDNTNDTHLILNSFNNNRASYGGAVYLSEVNGCEINACNFVRNYATGEYNFGGGIYSLKSNYVFILGCDFLRNSADTFAGALSLYQSEDCILEKCNFSYNTAEYIGGVFIYESSAALHLCNFIKNTAPGEDGVGGVYGGILIDCAFKDNTKPQYLNSKVFYGVKLSAKQTGSTCDNKVITATLSRLYGTAVIPNEKVEFNINGKIYTVKTNAKGQAILKVNLPAKKYAVTITHEGVGKYLTNSTKITIVIKKATPKIIASKKTFKVKTKSKAYTITLKNSKGNIMKKAKVTLKIKGKTYKATTNSKGKATFKITNLKKKGSTTATIKYAGSGYYNSVSKKVTITVKK